MRNPVLPFPPVCIYFMNPDHYFLSPSTARVTLARILLLGQLASSTKLCHRCLSLITCPTNPLLTWLQIRLPLLSFCLDLRLFLITCKEFVFMHLLLLALVGGADIPCMTHILLADPSRNRPTRICNCLSYFYLPDLDTACFHNHSPYLLSG